MSDGSLWDEIEEPTVSCDMDFTISHMQLVVEALGLYKDLGKKLAIGFATKDGPVLPQQLSADPVEMRNLHRQVMNGEAWISRTVGDTPFTEQEMNNLDKLMGHFIVGLTVLEAKYDALAESHSQQQIPAVVTAFYDLLKREGQNGKDKQ